MPLPLPRAAIVSVLCLVACEDDTPKGDTGTTPYSDCDLQVSTVDTPRQMVRDKKACRYRWSFFKKPAPTTITYLELETTDVSSTSDDTIPEGMRIGVLESYWSENVLYEDTVRFVKGDDRKVSDLGGHRWKGWFWPDPPLEMPTGAWFVDLVTDFDNCDDTHELTLTFEDVIGDDCGDPEPGTTKD